MKRSNLLLPNSNDIYQQTTPKIAKYIKNKNRLKIFKEKSILFASGSYKLINLFSNSLEFMGSLKGHNGLIRCLKSLNPITLASGDYNDGSIKIWDLEKNFSIVSTLSLHTDSTVDYPGGRLI